MNERIRELAVEANDQTGNKFDLNYKELDSFLEKFAELIVRECMWKIMVRKDEAIDNGWRVDEAMSMSLSDISEHFGVQE